MPLIGKAVGADEITRGRGVWRETIKVLLRNWLFEIRPEAGTGADGFEAALVINNTFQKEATVRVNYISGSIVHLSRIAETRDKIAESRGQVNIQNSL